MKTGDYFVMLQTPNGSYTPLMDDRGDEIAKFETIKAAKDGARSSLLGDKFGYEIFLNGNGEYAG